jgi:hypothetical protein
MGEKAREGTGRPAPSRIKRTGSARSGGLAAALALAGVLALATGVAGLATALAFTAVLAFAVVLAGGGIIGQLARE